MERPKLQYRRTSHTKTSRSNQRQTASNRFAQNTVIRQNDCVAAFRSENTEGVSANAQRLKWLFPSPVKEDDSPRDPHSIYSKMQKVLDRAECKRVRFHDLRHTFATIALEHGMDVKTLSATIGHTSSASTPDVYSHTTTEMKINAARSIDRGIGRGNPTVNKEAVPTPEKRPQGDSVPKRCTFKPTEGKIRKSGSGGLYQISDHLWEGRYTPTNAHDKRESHNVYAKTREECEERLKEMIVEVRAQIQAEKEQIKGMSL